MRTVSVPKGEAPEIATAAHTPLPVDPGAPVGTDATKEVPIDLYEEHRGRPYAADLFDLTSDYGKTGVENEVKLINDYVISEIESQGLTLTRESYQSIIAKIAAEMGIDPNLRGDLKAKRIAKYVSIVNEESKLAQERKALLNGS